MSEEENKALIAMADEDDEPAVEEVVEEATEETVEAEAAEEEAKPEKRSKTVPHQAFHQEREERKKWEAQAKQYAEHLARLDERMRMAAEKEQEVAPPDPDQDPIAAIRYERERREALEHQHAERQKQDQQAHQQRQYEQQVVNYATEHVTEYRAENPSYDEAVNYLETVRASELALFGLGQQEIFQQIQSEAMNLAANCAKRGANVAETIYKMAEVRGFKAKVDTQEAEQKIETVSRGQERGKTLSNAGGKSGGAEMTAVDLLKLPSDEFEAWGKKNPAKYKALMGG